MIDPAAEHHRLVSKIASAAKNTDPTTGCWIWAGAITAGYGRVKRNGRTDMAHRVAYELHVGPIPAGLHLDHLCRNRACVNPAHLEPVTRRTNILRGVGPTATNFLKAQCVNGHDLAIARVTADGRRDCRLCRNIRKAEARRAAKAVAA
jgi:hypothetical protein